MTPLPRISLITPSFQQARYLEECIASVHDQKYPNIEHIVVDGGSTDGSKAIIEKHADKFAWWCSKKDKGQSDAINKGLRHATGEVFGWLNSDDALLPGSLARVAHAFAADPELLVFGGRVVHRDAKGAHAFNALNDVHERERLFIEPVINQPATFYRTTAVRIIGGVDPRLRYVMDVELWWQLIFWNGIDHLRFDPVDLAAFRLHDESKTSTAILGFLDEIASLLHGLCVQSGNDDLADVLKVGHKPKRGLRGIPVNVTHGALVRAMTLHFLLKWNADIHRENQWRMMKALAGADRGTLTTEQQQRWRRIEDQLRIGSWKLFRAKRKLMHLLK